MVRYFLVGWLVVPCFAFSFWIFWGSAARHRKTWCTKTGTFCIPILKPIYVYRFFLSLARSSFRFVQWQRETGLQLKFTDRPSVCMHFHFFHRKFNKHIWENHIFWAINAHYWVPESRSLSECMRVWTLNSERTCMFWLFIWSAHFGQPLHL